MSSLSQIKRGKKAYSGQESQPLSGRSGEGLQYGCKRYSGKGSRGTAEHGLALVKSAVQRSERESVMGSPGRLGWGLAGGE